MPWEGVTVSEQRGDFIRDYVDGYYSKTELAETVRDFPQNRGNNEPLHGGRT